MQLAQACESATFGFNQQAVLDENYCKAGELDTSRFSLVFDPLRCGLMDAIREVLLEGHTNDRRIKVERYTLNVYGTIV